MYFYFFGCSFRAGLFVQWRSDREELQQEGELGSSLDCGVIPWGEISSSSLHLLPTASWLVNSSRLCCVCGWVPGHSQQIQLFV